MYFYQTFSPEVCATFWKGHTMTLLKSIMKSWGKRKVKVQRGPNLPLYIANKYNFDPSCVLLPNIFPRGLCYFLERTYCDLTKKYNEVLGKPNLPLYMAISIILTPPVCFYQTFFPEVYVSFWKGHSITSLKSIMNSWGKWQVKVQRGTNLPLCIANKYNFDPSCVLLPNVFPRGLCYFFEKPYYDLTKKYNKVLGKT